MLRAKREHTHPVIARLACGAVVSVTVPDENGITTYNLWRDAEGAAAFSRQPKVLAAQARSGLPAPTAFARHDDVDTIVTEALMRVGGTDRSLEVRYAGPRRPRSSGDRAPLS